MRCFVLTTGRSGSLTLAKAFRHATNYTAAHESGRLNRYSLEYPENHIEVDNRLTWFVGSLAVLYPEARWVWLRRDPVAAAASYQRKRPSTAIKLIGAICQGRLKGRAILAQKLIRTMEENIAEFLRDRPHHVCRIERAPKEFPAIWQSLGCTGDLAAAVAEFDHRYNASPPAQTEATNARP